MVRLTGSSSPPLKEASAFALGHTAGATALAPAPRSAATYSVIHFGDRAPVIGWGYSPDDIPDTPAMAASSAFCTHSPSLFLWYFCSTADHPIAATHPSLSLRSLQLPSFDDRKAPRYM